MVHGAPFRLRHPGLDALNRAIDQLAGAERWLGLPDSFWLPAADRALVAG
jgi:hypothetical protein